MIVYVIADIISSLTARIIWSLLKLFGSKQTVCDLEFPVTGIPLEETSVSIPNEQYGEFTIRGRVHELKQGMELAVKLPPGTSRMIIAGWGVVAGTDRFFGALTDPGEIGVLLFFDLKKRRLRNPIKIVLPAGSHKDDIRLADANPIISGEPPPELVIKSGFLLRITPRYNPKGRAYWDHANVWLTEVDVPPRTRSAVFKAENGSMNIVHIRAIRGFRFLQNIGRLRRESHRETISYDYQSWNIERDLLFRRATDSENDALNSKSDGNKEQYIANSISAAKDYISLAYLPGSESNRALYLASTAQNYVNVADASDGTGDIETAAKYYVLAFFAYEQSDKPINTVLVDKIISVLTELDVYYRERDILNVDMLIRTWYNAGLICLETARLSRENQSDYFKKAWNFYNKVVSTILETKSDSFPDLRFAQERLMIIKSEHDKLNIFAPEIIPAASQQLQLVQDAMNKYLAESRNLQEDF